MGTLSRRSVLRSSAGFFAAGTLMKPFVADAAAKTATVWWVQGFAEQEDISFKKVVADYEKASGNTLDYSIIPMPQAAKGSCRRSPVAWCRTCSRIARRRSSRSMLGTTSWST